MASVAAAAGQRHDVLLALVIVTVPIAVIVVPPVIC